MLGVVIISFLRSCAFALKCCAQAIGVLAALIAVVGEPSVASDPDTTAAHGAVSAVVRYVLEILQAYPLGFVLGLVAVAFLHWLSTHDHVGSLKAEVEQARKKARSKIEAERRHKAKAKGKGGRK